MRIDKLKEFKRLHAALIAEKADIEAKLNQISQVLESAPAGGSSEASPSRPKRVMGRNAMSLKEAVIQAVSKKPLSKEDILDAIQKLGYQFNTKNPMNSLGVVLYGSKKPKFKRENGLFSAS